MFKKILIANRGEIACRIIKTAKKLGIQTVAVYSEADCDAYHVKLADESVLLGPAPSSESYLAADKIIAACKRVGAEAIHPGYGFLSENEIFSRQVEEQGIVFIGPKHYSIASMGDKITSKKLAVEAGVNTIPGYTGVVGNAKEAVKIARDVGYPVMIKASAGGGGKGLRIANNDVETLEGFESCGNEARKSFSDDRLFIEKYIEEPRHIEVQVLGDAYGNVVHLHERECSIQRRHQKMIEEAPSPFISDATRERMCKQAITLARAVRYQSAGTVEFVVGKDQNFYFLEMNTRLQVEHPVTECITGLDLVEQMIRIASGERLSFRQEEIPRRGWAMECRINAENPFRNFLPSTGRLVYYLPPLQTMEAALPPPEDGGIRIDSGVHEGGEITIYYDSMIAKLIAYGRDRMNVILRMREALNAFVIHGVNSNIPFQAALLVHPEFVSGNLNTGFIAKHYPEGFCAEAIPHDDLDLLVAIAAMIDCEHPASAFSANDQLRKRGACIDVSLMLVMRNKQSQYRHFPVSIEFRDRLAITANGKKYKMGEDWRFERVRCSGSINEQFVTVQLERNGVWLGISHNGTRIDVMVLSQRAAELAKLMPRKTSQDTNKFLVSPMPGLLTVISVEPGQRVCAGEKLAVVEAMKMENSLFADQDGLVVELLAKIGDNLFADQPIVRFA